MATFYIQLENKLLQISGELTAENISKALGYVPVSPNVTNELSQRVDNITFDSLKDNPFLQDGSGELNIVDEAGNIIAKIDTDGIHSVDFIAGEHRLSNKTDKTYVDEAVKNVKVDLTGYATEEWVEDKNYLTEHQDISHLATKEEVADVDFYDIKNNPITNTEEGNLIFVDETGNIGLKLDSDNNLTVKDVIAGDNILSNKVDKESGKGLSTEDFTTALKNKLQSLSNYDDTSITEAVNSLRTDFNTLVSGDTSTAIKTFNEIIAFLEGVEDTESLSGIIASIEQQIANIEIPSLDGYATEDYVNQKEQAIQTWVNNKNYLTEHQDISHLATKDEVSNIDFYNIKDNPIVNNGDGKLLFVDENGYIGLQLEEDGLYVKDVIADGHKLSDKADKSELSNYATKDEVSDLVDMSVVTELQGKVNTLIDTDADKSVRDIAVDVLTETLVSETATEAYDTLAEMSAWIKSHPEDAAAMNEAIQKNASDITNTLISAKSYTDETVADVDFYSIKNNPIVNSEDSTLTFVDETGYIGLKVTEDGLVVKDVVTPEHTLSNKADKSELPTKVSDLTNDSGFITLADVPEVEIPSLDGYVKSEDLPNFDEFAKTEDIPSLDGYATEQWVNNKNYATEYDLKTIDYSSINNVPVSEDETGELNIIDESGNVGMKISSEAVYAKDFISGEHKLTEKLDSNNLKTINNESLVGDGNIVVGNIVSEEDDSLTIDDVNTNTYVKYVAQTLTEEQKAQVRTNIGVGEGGGTNITEQTILDWGFTKNTGTYSKPSAGIPKTDLTSEVQTSLGLADTSIQSKIITSTVRTGTVNISVNTMTHLTNGLTGSTTILITHKTVTSDAEWGVKFFINGTTVPSITFASSSTSYPIAWINNTTPSFETGYIYEVTFKQFNNKYLAVCGKFKI